MHLTDHTRLECGGIVKYSGIETGSVPWKNGKLIIQKVNGIWQIGLEYDVNKGQLQKPYMLYPNVIQKLICKAQFVIELQPNNSHMSFFIKPQSPRDVTDMKRVYEKLQEIQNSKDEPARMKAEVKLTPSKQILSNNSSQDSPEAFTSVKSKDSRKRLLDDDDDDESKENINRMKTAKESFLERGWEKSKMYLPSESTPIKFYGNKSPGSTYANFSKRPGLLPDPTPRSKHRLSDYSWLKPKVTSPTESNQQQNLHGFSNLGNTCYMNAILQSLVNLDTFTTDLLYGNKRIERTLSPTSLYKCMMNVFNSRIRNVPDFSKREYLKNLKQAISSSARRFSGYQQHDAHEFLGQLLDQLKEEVTKISKSTPSPHREGQETENRTSSECVNPTVQNFEFEVLHRIRCESCGEEVSKEEQFIDLSVDMPRSKDPSNPRSLQDALEMSLRKENIEYTCEKCNCNKAIVTHKFTKLPRVLVLHLKRYSYNMMMSRQSKAGQNIAIPRYLTLQSHCEEETRPPYPTIPPPEPKSIPIPDSPLREKNENTPRRRLDTTPGFRFKKVRALPDFDIGDDDKTSAQQTSTPNKKPKEESDVITDRKLTLDDDFDDPEIAKALELSLKEANDRAQGYYDEVDGMTEDSELKKALEMSRQETESMARPDHEYDPNIRALTEEEQIELAMRRSIMDFEMMNNSYAPEDVRKECSSAVASNLFLDEEHEKFVEDIVTSKYFKNEVGRLKNFADKNSRSEEKMDSDCSPLKSCDNRSTYELTENLYFHEQSSVNKNNHRGMLCNEENSSFMNGDTNTNCLNERTMIDSPLKSEKGASDDNEVMIISDNTDSETEKVCDVSKSHKKTFDLSMETSGPETGESQSDEKKKMCNLRPKSKNDNLSEKKLSKDIENILMVDEMTSGDIRPIRTVNKEDQSKNMVEDTELPELKQSDILDLFCNEDDDFVMDQWDKENCNPDTTKDEEESLPKIDNEKGELPYSYRLVCIVNHIGSSSVVGHYVSDVYDIKKSSWFSCDDSHVSRTTETEVRSKRERSGYIFFYLNKDIFDDLKDHYAIHANKKKENADYK